MERLVIDTDPGVDDAQAIMMAVAHPEALVEAITTVAGNVPLELTTLNARIILEQLGCDAPVFPGCDRALVNVVPDAADVHGGNGLGGVEFPEPGVPAHSEHAANALVRLANEKPGALTLVAIGPLTNLALATRLDPALPDKFKRLVVMGGTIRGMGNTNITSAEFNFYVDPEAAAIVLREWPGLELISWETTMDHGFAMQELDAILATDSPRAAFFKQITAKTIKYIKEKLGREMMFGADPLAMAVALEPDIVKRSEHRYMQVELQGPRGQSTVDWFHLTGCEPNVHVVLEADMDRFLALLKMAVE